MRKIDESSGSSEQENDDDTGSVGGSINNLNQAILAEATMVGLVAMATGPASMINDRGSIGSGNDGNEASGNSKGDEAGIK